MTAAAYEGRQDKSSICGHKNVKLELFQILAFKHVRPPCLLDLMTKGIGHPLSAKASTTLVPCICYNKHNIFILNKIITFVQLSHPLLSQRLNFVLLCQVLVSFSFSIYSAQMAWVSADAMAFKVPKMVSLSSCSSFVLDASHLFHDCRRWKSHR